MRGGRVLVIVGLVLLVGAVAVGVILLRRQPPTPVAEVEEGTPLPELPTSMTEIVVAVQNIPRGMRITEDINAVTLQSWPADTVPEGAITDLEAAYGRTARVDIVRGMPILEDMLTEVPGELAAIGSDAALQIPPGKVAYALPVARYSSVAWALQPGDHVDVILSVLLVDLDEEFQTILPNQMACISPAEGEGCVGGPIGRTEVLPNGWLVNVTASEEQRPRLVTQLTVQDAIVLRVGDWPSGEEASPSEEGQPQEGAEQPTPPARPAVEPLTLIVTPQDAMVLKYAEEAGASIDLVLRSAGDTGLITTESVTLQYLLDRFNIELPAKLPYGITPPLQSLQPGAAGEGGGGGGEQRPQQ